MGISMGLPLSLEKLDTSQCTGDLPGDKKQGLARSARAELLTLGGVSTTFLILSKT
jgi:hypothetical protein